PCPPGEPAARARPRQYFAAPSGAKSDRAVNRRRHSGGPHRDVRGCCPTGIIRQCAHMAANLVTLRDGRGQSIVFFHPASGLATAFRRLAPYLPTEAAVFAFENAEPVGPPSSIDAIAASYWSELRSVADGSLFLVGWSFGGTVALELATIA